MRRRMEQFDDYLYNYVCVKGDSLKETNDNTRKMWEDAVNTGYVSIINITEPKDKCNVYLVDCSLYHNLLQAAREGKDIDPYGIANVNFSLIKRTDDRWEEFYKQRLEKGFDDSETWSLDATISRFIAPRLKRFKEITIAYPPDLTELEWNSKLDKMITAFDYINDDNLGVDDKLTMFENENNRQKVIDEGLDLFRKHFFNLWW